MNNERLTIFVSSPDSYSDVFAVYIQCFKRFWPNCRYELVLATNTEHYEGVTVINNDNPGDSWTERAIPALSFIRTKYVLNMVDDFFITEPVDNTKIESILDEMDAYKINFCGLSNHLKGEPLRDKSSLLRVNKRKAYAKNLQFGIFNREYLIDILGNGNESPWDLEKKWVKETLDAQNEYFDDIVSCEENIVDCIHGVVKGKWLPSALKKLKELNIEIDSEREILTKREEIKIHMIAKMGKKFSPNSRKKLKRILSKFGYKFVTEN